MTAVWRAAGRGRGRGSARTRTEPEVNSAEDEGELDEGGPGDGSGALHEGLVVDVGGAEEGHEDRWWEDEWRVTPGSWSNGPSWNGRHGQDSWYHGAWRDYYVARIEETTWGRDGRWQGSSTHANSHESWRGTDDGGDWGRQGRPTEKMTVPTFDGEGGDSELGTSARSYLRRVAAWNRCTKLAETEKALALYTNLSGRAWLFAEELDVDRLGSRDGMAHFLEWVRVRFMEIEINKVGGIMNELFRKCRKRSDQSVRDYNMEFERLLLRLGELNCELPNLVKAWLYVDRLKMSEHDEVALLASVGNQYDLRALQQAALVQDRGTTKKVWDRGSPGRWKSQQSVHVTAAGEDCLTDEEAPEEIQESDSEIMDEGVASEMHSAYMAFQNAKSKYREAMKGRGLDKEELKKRSEERLRLAKARSYCVACKRRGHWHKDPECPLRGASAGTRSSEPKGAQMTQHVQMCFMTKHGNYIIDEVDIPVEPFGITNESWMTHESQENEMSGDYGAEVGLAYDAWFPGKAVLAIADTACTKTVAGHQWYEEYCAWADANRIPVEPVEERDSFKFGASRVHPSPFAVWAHFGIGGRHVRIKVAVVQCKVPLLFSRGVLAKLGMVYRVGEQRADLLQLHLHNVEMQLSDTGHPALVVSDFPEDLPSWRAQLDIWSRGARLGGIQNRAICCCVRGGAGVRSLYTSSIFSKEGFYRGIKHADASWSLIGIVFHVVETSKPE